MSKDSDLKIDGDVLEELGRKLRFVATEFENADGIADDYGDFVSHGGLADKLNEFADNWDDTRNKMLESIASFGEAAKAAGEAFAKLEEDLAKTLRGEKK